MYALFGKEIARLLGLRQPAAALVQAACCRALVLKVRSVQSGCPQQAVESKAAAGCSSPNKGTAFTGF